MDSYTSFKGNADEALQIENVCIVARSDLCFMHGGC